MTTTAPLLDPRTAVAIRDQVTGDLATNLGAAWVPEGDQASAALIAIIARFGEIVIERLNQAPDKNLLAFLDLLGTTPLPPAPARVPLTFTVATGSTTDAVVPAGTKVASPAGEGETDPVVFETERELTAVAATLQTLVAVDAERDLIADHSALLAAPAPNGVRVFVGDQANQHVLYIGLAAYLSIAHLNTLTLTVQMSSDSPTVDARVVTWELWDGVNGIPLTPTSDTTQQLTATGAVTFANLTQVAQQTVNGVGSRWLRCRLLTPVSGGSTPAQGMIRAAQLPLVSSIRASAAISDTTLIPDVAFANQQAVDVTRAFLPFGDKPKIGDVFYLGQRAAFAQPGSAITLNVTLASPPPSATVPSSDLTLRWEAWNGSKWSLLGTTKRTGQTGEGSLVDTSKAFTISNSTVTFTLPASLGPTIVNGVQANWVRVQITAGNYGVDSTYTPDANAPGGFVFSGPPTFVAPLVSALTINYAVTTTPTAPDAVVAFNNAQFQDLGSAVAAGRAAPFVGLPSQQSAVYAAFTLPPTRQSFPNRPVSLYHGVRQPPFGEQPTPLSPELSVLPATAGSTVVHHFTLVNTSSGSVDCQLATLGGAWTSSLAPDQRQFPLPHGTTDVQVSVSVPASNLLPAANVSDRGFLTVRLSSDSVVHAVGFETRVGKIAPRRRDLRFEYWNGTAWTRLVASDSTDLLERPGIVEFIGPADFTPTQLFGTSAYWMRELFEPGDEPQPQLRTLLPNTTFATNTVTLRNEVIGTSDASASQTFHATRTPVLVGPRLEVREPGPPSAEELTALGAPDVSVLTPVTGSSEVWVRWVEVTDFHTSGAGDRHYVLDHITGEVRFGDGVQGRIPPRGIGNIRMARYQTGGGGGGNRAAGTIIQLHNSVAFVDSVTNIESAEGGFDAESTPAMLTRAPRSLRHGGRAVAVEDYEDLARAASPEVARAKTIPASQLPVDAPRNPLVPGAGEVSVIIVPQSTEAKPVPSVGLIAEVQDYLQALVTPTVSLAVIGPVYVRVDVIVEIALVSLDGANQVQDAIRDSLSVFLHPLTGGRDGTGWNFGRQPQLSDLYALISGVPGVDHIRHLSTNLVEEPAKALESGRFLVHSGEHQIALTFVGAE